MPTALGKEIARVYTFASDSNPSKTYESLEYTDGSSSCACPGWTRRVSSDGSRTCKHTRVIDQGIAESHCVSSHEYTFKATKPVNHIQTTVQVKSAKMKAIPLRKIQWEI